jgi:two-component system, chemotaxis family, sensor kinase CheA
MNLDDALHTFIEEANDLLQQMEAALLGLEQAPADTDTINAMFRAAHTIKGSSGLFGFDAIVAFTHVAESVLDKVRNGELGIDAALVATFLRVCDHIGVLVKLAADGTVAPDAETQARGQQLVDELNVYLGVSPSAAKAKETSVAAVEPGTVYRIEGDGVSSDNWHISLRFGPDVLRYGMDPIACLRYLQTLGCIEHIVTLVEPVPQLTAIDPETCYLGLEISFKSEADKAAIEGAFDFVRESSHIRILPPHSKMSSYLDFIHDMPPAEELLLGDILVRCGTLTQSELQAALRSQAAAAAQTPGKPMQPIGQVLVEQNMVQPKVVEAALDKQKQIKEHKAAESNFIRVDARRLDQLINLVGELIITGAGTALAAQRLNDGDLLEITATMGRLVEEVRDSALNLRMVQIGATFGRFQRVVHDMSKDLGKDIHLVISGEDTELDKTVVEKIGDPLTHLVRNSMDHGIESAEERIAAGKPAHGTLRLNAYHDSGAIVIEVSDDGGGLKRDKILAKAIERGLVDANANLSDKEIYSLIFEPGFSTAEKVSNLSGRGVGMDVVRRNIQALRGTVELDSKPGEGTVVRIHLPLTLAIIDGFLVGVGDASYVLPLDMVVECIELRRRRTADDDDATDEDEEMVDDDVQYDDLLDGEASHYLNLRGEVLPFLRLREALDVEGPPSERQSVVVVQFGGHKAGLVVDHLVGETQTVIKPLGKVFQKMKGIGGFTIMGNGAVALVIDVPGLMHRFTDPVQLALAA